MAGGPLPTQSPMQSTYSVGHVNDSNGIVVSGFPYTFSSLPGAFQPGHYAPGLRIRQISPPYKARPPLSHQASSYAPAAPAKEALAVEPISRHDRENVCPNVKTTCFLY